MFYLKCLEERLLKPTLPCQKKPGAIKLRAWVKPRGYLSVFWGF
ncbi:MAG: hypothetical protein WCL32_22155 [Planctomycetota bacterium]